MDTYTAFCAANRLPQKAPTYRAALTAAQQCLRSNPVGVVAIRRDSDGMLVTPAQHDMHHAHLPGLDLDGLYSTYGQPDTGA